MKPEILAITDKNLQRAGEALRAGGLVAMPTETVYGLAANALDGQAVARVFEAKGRPSFNPLIVHVASKAQAEDHVQVNALAAELMARFWPGPLTLVLNKNTNCTVSDICSAGLDTIAIRMPAHEGARKLIEAAGVPLAAPSANASGEISPTSPKHVADSLGDKVDIILAGGSCAVGLESTVVDCSGDAPVLLRPGGVTKEEIESALGINIAVASHEDEKPKSPGMLLKHYAPSIPVRLNAVDVKQGEALLGFGSLKFMGVAGGGFAKDLPEGRIMNLSDNGDLHEAAANLFAMMRALDQAEYSGIAVMNIPESGIGMAINDRLRRAAKG